MGLDTQAVLKGHVSADRVSGILRDDCGVVPTVRATHSKDYWMVEFADKGGLACVVNVFTNSYAATDYQELDVTDSTLLTMEFGPSSRPVLEALVSRTGGWVRNSDGTPWVEVTG